MEINKHIFILLFVLIYTLVLVWGGNKFFLRSSVKTNDENDEGGNSGKEQLMILAINLNILVFIVLAFDVFVTYVDYQANQEYSYFKLFTLSSLLFLADAIALLVSFYAVKLFFRNGLFQNNGVQAGAWIAVHAVFVLIQLDLFKLLTSHHAFSIF